MGRAEYFVLREVDSEVGLDQPLERPEQPAVVFHHPATADGCQLAGVVEYLIERLAIIVQEFQA